MQDLPPHWLAGGVDWLHRYGLIAPIVQLLLVTVLGFAFAERWQRWRQRRDFQYRTLVRFSELSTDLMDRLSELLVMRGRIATEAYAEKRREMIARWTSLASMRPEVMACFGRAFILSEDYQRMFTALSTLMALARAPEPVPLARFEPEEEKFLAHREAVVANMVRAMGFVSNRECRAEIEHAHKRVKKANEILDQGGAVR